tara:strand:+ start:3561 stop:4028 length:468 start_codon:yes stop_codon:yes gene_type:complete
MYIRGYYPKTGKHRRYAITSDGWHDKIGSVSIESQAGTSKYHVFWSDGEGRSIEGTVYRDALLGFTQSQRSRPIHGYSLHPLYVNGYFIGSETLPQFIPGVFTSKGQWPCIIEAIEFAQKYPIKEEEEVQKPRSWIKIPVISGIVGFVASLFLKD